MGAKPTQIDVLIATIGRPHGVRGLVHLYPMTESPDSVETLGVLHDDSGNLWRVQWKAPGIAALSTGAGEVLSSRSDVEKLVNRRLYVAREALPKVEDDIFYHVDLIGMEAVSPQGERLGNVVVVHDYGAGTSLELGNGVLVPFTMACIPEIDRKENRLVVILPEEIEVEGDLSGDVQVRS